MVRNILVAAVVCASLIGAMEANAKSVNGEEASVKFPVRYDEVAKKKSGWSFDPLVQHAGQMELRRYADFYFQRA